MGKKEKIRYKGKEIEKGKKKGENYIKKSEMPVNRFFCFIK